MVTSPEGVLARLGTILLPAICLACASLPPLSATEGIALSPGWQPLGEGIGYAAFAYGGPRSEVHALRVELDAVDLVVTPGGPAFGQVTGRSVLEFAREFDCLAAINATPYYPESYRKEEPRSLSGVLVVEGRPCSAPASRFSALVVGWDGRAAILGQAELPDAASIRYAIGGFYPLLESGAIVARKSAREPMTAVGLLEGGRALVAIVIDGRRPGSAGMSELEAARLLLALGAVDAMSFDGGGSSAMVLRGSDGKRRMVNTPLHFGSPAIERIVGTCLGFRSRP